mmetsp:Transcript_34399/g.73276  ORF Transcript_34399/g.73276 Transcript_34399/m.73276 type:complete len:91 (+) Transcript_34399:220-492(+)
MQVVNYDVGRSHSFQQLSDLQPRNHLPHNWVRRNKLVYGSLPGADDVAAKLGKVSTHSTSQVTVYIVHKDTHSACSNSKVRWGMWTTMDV